MTSGKRVPRARVSWWRCVCLTGLSTILIVAGGCGKSERQKLEEKAADDARWDAAVAAADAERQKEEQRLTDKEVSRLSASNTTPNSINKPGTPTAAANPAIRPSGWAVSTGNVTKQNMDDAEAAAIESIRVASLNRVKEQQLAGWEQFLPYHLSANPVFRNAHWNVAQTAICGEVDFLWSPPDGSKAARSGFRKFVLGNTTPQTIAYGRKDNTVAFYVGIDVEGGSYHWFTEHYAQIMAVTDCTPDMDH